MTDWLNRLFTEPVDENMWALGLFILMAAAFVGPLLIMMGRDMWRRHKETTVTDETQPAQKYEQEMPANDDEQDPQTERRAAAMEELAIRPADLGEALKGADIYRDPDPADVARWKREGISTTGTNIAAGKAPVPTPIINPARIDCTHCGGRGYVPGLNDLLNESLALLGDQGDEVIRAFYSRLFMVASGLAALFPGNPTEGDLGTDHKGARQRERLLNAIAALADLYDPADADKMERLDSALERFGRSHAAFARPDGTIKGATIEEYAAVKDALFTTLVRTAQDAWKAEYTEAWSQAYDYAAGMMVAAQYRSGFTAPRFARQG